jgi:hypothetical protein
MKFKKYENDNMKFIEVAEMTCWIKDGKELIAKGFTSNTELNTYIDKVVQNLNELRGKGNDK